MARLETWYKQDLKRPLVVHKHTDVFNQDSKGNLIGVEVYSDGEPVVLVGSISGYCLLADGTTVPAVGANRSGNKASVLIPQTAYSVPGPITITIKNVDGDNITTLCATVGVVRQSVSGNLVNPGSVVTDWSNNINAQLQAVQTAADNVGAIVADPFDENTVYVVGNYVTNNGNLYRITADHAAGVAWSGTAKVQCTVGHELEALNKHFIANWNLIDPDAASGNETGFIPVELNVRYNIIHAQSKGQFRYGLSLYDSNKTMLYISQLVDEATDGTNYSYSCTFSESDIAYVKIKINSAPSGIDTTDFSKVYFGKGSEYIEFADYNVIHAIKKVKDDVSDLADEISDLNSALGTVPSGKTAQGQITDNASDIANLKSVLDNTSQVVYKTEISSLVGLIPFHAKNGDSITIKTKDGSNFVGNDQLRFYDANGAIIAYWSTAPTTVNSRTFVYDNETEALYIGLTKVASSVIDYVVVNTSSPYLTDITDREAALQNQINAVDNRSTVKNLSELFVYEQPSISVSSGLLPFPVKTNDSITIERIDGQLFQGTVQIKFYDENKNYINYIGTIPHAKATRTVTFSYADAYYVGVTDVGSVAGTYRVINNNSKSLLFAEINERKAFDTLISNRVDILDSQAAKAKVINRFNKATITAGKYINPNTGNLNSSDDFFASDFIYIGDLASVTVSYTHIFCWYDENKEWKGHPDNMNSGSADLTYSIPEDVVYLRFSAYNANLNSAQVGESVTRNNYAPFGVYNLPELRVSQSQIDTSSGSQIVVDASGGGDYTSFTQAIYDTVDDGTDVFVKPGTYDIVAEYIALFGQSAVDSMADSDSAIFNGFQYGVRLRKRKVEFAPGAHLVCDWTGHTVNGTHRFSALGVDYNVEIIGLDLDVTATFYCIHDDYGIATPYTVKYENCRVVGHNITNANCIGGGCKKYSRHILNNCYFDNNLTGSATVRYHNTNAEGAEPEIYVSNCYFNNWFTPRWYGPQTSKMRVYVNNCHARAIYKIAESSSYDVDNVELYKWNNEETDQRD